MEGVLYLCMHTLKACICRRILLFMWYVHISMCVCCVHYVCICMSAWERLNIYISVSSNIYIYIYSKSILQCPTYFGWFYFFLAFCVNPKLLCRRNKIGKLGKLRCAFGGKAARRLRCWWRGDKAFGWRGGVAGAVRASVLLAAFVLVSTCVCVCIVCGWYGHSMNISILVDVACCMHGEKATLHVEYWWSWCARKTWGYCFCSICVSGPLLYTCTGGARVTVYASISIDSSKHTHIFCVCVLMVSFTCQHLESSSMSFSMS